MKQKTNNEKNQRMRTQLERLEEAMIPSILIPSEFLERAWREHCTANPVSDTTPWEDWGPKTPFRQNLYLRADSFKPMPDIFGRCLPLQFGDWTIKKRVLPQTERLRLYQKAGQGRPKMGWSQFDRDITITVLMHRSRGAIMGLTPNECISVKTGSRFATGSVVITGLGLGYLAYLVCQRPQVASVTVIEKDPGIVKHVWPRLLPHLKYGKPKIILDDCMNVLTWMHADVLLADHFDGYGWNSDWLDYGDKGRVIKANFKRIWTWG